MTLVVKNLVSNAVNKTRKMVIMSQGIGNLIDIDKFLNAFIERVIEFWNGKRLRDYLIFGFLFGIFLLCMLLIFIPKYLISIIPIFVGILLGIPVGNYFVIGMSKNIKNNFYYLKDKVFTFKTIVLGILILLVCQLINTYVGEFYRVTYFYLPVAVAFPSSTVIPLFWLIKYERKNGAVYVVETKKG